MRTLLLSLLALAACSVSAQNNTASTIIEGGKTLVELVRVFKTPKTTLAQQPVSFAERKDSCAVKNISDISIRNSTDRSLLVTVYRRNGNAYEPGGLSFKIMARNQETIYELKAGIYKIKYETEDDKKIIQEGEIKLLSCINLFKEIKNE